MERDYPEHQAITSIDKPRLTASEAFHRLVPSEGQKEMARRLKAVQETQKMEEIIK